MPHLSELILFPIKSCGGMSVPAATLTRAGLMADAIHDREWMVVDGAGRFLSQREHPGMALIAPRLAGDMLAVSAPGMPDLAIPLAAPDPATAPTLAVQVWDDMLTAHDCDAPTAAWFSQALGVACRLARFHPDARRLANAKWTGEVAAPTRFSDGFPLLVVGAASLTDVNGKLVAAGRAPIPMNRFRPNLVIDGIEAFEEDYAESFQLGAVVLKPVKPCPRCPMPSVDQATGQFGPDPLEIMQSYRAKEQVDGAICFGMNSIVTAGEGERLHVGQEITVTLSF